jgi:hypothetical protein
VSKRTEDRISSNPDALDLALNVGGVFDGDDDAPALEDLGGTWLEQATESDRSLGFADTIPDIEALLNSIEKTDEGSDDEHAQTTKKYVRHRISRAH